MCDDDKDYQRLLRKLEHQQKVVSDSINEVYISFCNNPPESQDSLGAEKFAVALQHLILNDYDPLMFDSTLSFVKAITLLKNTVAETEKQVAYQKAKIQKLDSELELHQKNTLAIIAAKDDYKAKQKIPPKTLLNEQFQKAKSKFGELKENLNNIVATLYPKESKKIVSLMADICKSHFDGTEYTKIPSNIDIKVLETLMMAQIISQHPNEQNMFKLSL